MPISIFISYAHRDEELKNELLKQLSPLVNEGLITTFDDRALPAGAEVDPAIAGKLEAADLILLMVSADFMASKYCYGIEMKRAVERHDAKEARVIPVILRDVEWRTSPFGKLLAVPTDGKPVDGARKRRDKALKDVASQIRAVVTTMPPPVPRRITNLPPPNPNFTGREELLARLRDSLSREHTAAVVQAISGMGGVGKTQLAVKYAERHAAEYDIVWWIRSELTTTIASDLAALATPLQLPERNLADQGAIVEAVKSALRDRGRWLLIFDNVEKAEDVKPFLPVSNKGGHVVITSRNPAWGKLGEPIKVDVLSREAAVEFLLHRTAGSDAEAADLVAEELGDLPLALEQAGAYVEKTGVTLGDYLDLFRNRRQDLWKREAALAEIPVATTLRLSMDKVAAVEPAALELLRLYSFLAPEDIPRTLLDGLTSEHLTDALSELAADKLRLNDAVSALRQYSLIETRDDFCAVHRLVQLVMRDTQAADEVTRWIVIAGDILWQRIPNLGDASRWPAMGVLLPHIARVIETGVEAGVPADLIGGLLGHIGRYLAVRGDLTGSIAARRRRISILIESFGKDDHRVAAARADLGAALADIGNVQGALEELGAALTIARAVFGEDSQMVAEVLGMIGFTFLQMQAFGEAAKVLRRATDIDERLNLPQSVNVARRLENLGVALVQIDQAGEGLMYARKSFAMKEQLFGPNSPPMAAANHNLAGALAATGDLDGADEHFDRALEISGATFGAHPITHRIEIVYATYCCERGDLARAVELVEQGVAGLQQFFGIRHAEIAMRVDNFTEHLRKAGHTALADEYAKRAEALRPPD